MKWQFVRPAIRSSGFVYHYWQLLHVSASCISGHIFYNRAVGVVYSVHLGLGMRGDPQISELKLLSLGQRSRYVTSTTKIIINNNCPTKKMIDDVNAVRMK